VTDAGLGIVDVSTIEADDPEWLGYAVFGLLTIVCALSILLWAAIVHRRSVRAKWVLTALNVATLPLSFIDTGPDLRSWEWQWAEIGSVVLSYAALVGLLTPAAKRWFRHDPGNLDQVFR